MKTDIYGISKHITPVDPEDKLEDGVQSYSKHGISVISTNNKSSSFNKVRAKFTIKDPRSNKTKTFTKVLDQSNMYIDSVPVSSIQDSIFSDGLVTGAEIDSNSYVSDLYWGEAHNMYEYQEYCVLVPTTYVTSYLTSISIASPVYYSISGITDFIVDDTKAIPSQPFAIDGRFKLIRVIDYIRIRHYIRVSPSWLQSMPEEERIRLVKLGYILPVSYNASTSDQNRDKLYTDNVFGFLRKIRDIDLSICGTGAFDTSYPKGKSYITDAVSNVLIVCPQLSDSKFSIQTMFKTSGAGEGKEFDAIGFKLTVGSVSEEVMMLLYSSLGGLQLNAKENSNINTFKAIYKNKNASFNIYNFDEPLDRVFYFSEVDYISGTTMGMKAYISKDLYYVSGITKKILDASPLIQILIAPFSKNMPSYIASFSESALQSYVDMHSLFFSFLDFKYTILPEASSDALSDPINLYNNPNYTTTDSPTKDITHVVDGSNLNVMVVNSQNSNLYNSVELYKKASQKHGFELFVHNASRSSGSLASTGLILGAKSLTLPKFGDFGDNQIGALVKDGVLGDIDQINIPPFILTKTSLTVLSGATLDDFYMLEKYKQIVNPTISYVDGSAYGITITSGIATASPMVDIARKIASDYASSINFNIGNGFVKVNSEKYFYVTGVQSKITITSQALIDQYGGSEFIVYTGSSITEHMAKVVNYDSINASPERAVFSFARDPQNGDVTVSISVIDTSGNQVATNSQNSNKLTVW